MAAISESSSRGRGRGRGRAGYGLSTSHAQRIHSRNRVIDDWLDEEDGSDAYADLEDFLVE